LPYASAVVPKLVRAVTQINVVIYVLLTSIFRSDRS